MFPDACCDGGPLEHLPGRSGVAAPVACPPAHSPPVVRGARHGLSLGDRSSPPGNQRSTPGSQ